MLFIHLHARISHAVLQLISWQNLLALPGYASSRQEVLENQCLPEQPQAMAGGRPFFSLQEDDSLYILSQLIQQDQSQLLTVVTAWCCPLLCLVTQSCLTLCKPMDSSLPGFPVHDDFPGKNTGVGCHALLQRIFPTQESNSGLPHCRWILYPLSYQGHPRRLEWVAYPFSRRSSLPGNWAGVSCIAGGFFTSWTTREAPLACYNILYSLPFISCLAFSFLPYKWHRTPVLLPGKFHGRRSLVGYSPWGRKESDTTEQLHFHFLQIVFPGINSQISTFNWILVSGSASGESLTMRAPNCT